MTIEEMKQELEKHGYSVVKKRLNQKFLPCICGYNRRKTISHYGMIGYVCNKCKLMSPVALSREEAKTNWNQMISGLNAGEPWSKVYYFS